jgi:hypothetical protein
MVPVCIAKANRLFVARGNTRSEGRQRMSTPYFICEDGGQHFEKTEFVPDVEDALVACPVCGGMDIQLVEGPAGEAA